MKKILFIISFLFAFPAYGATFSLSVEQTNLKIHDQVEVGVFVDTDGQSINALEGTIVIPKGLQVKNINDGNSVISLWVTKPIVEKDTITFSGVVPNGFTGNRKIFSFIGELVDSGKQTIVFSRITGLLNDGLGTGVISKDQALSLMVSKETGGGMYINNYQNDHEQPESFVPLVGQNKEMFEGAYFVSFSTVDKNSGIREYAVAEKNSFFTPDVKTVAWVKGESPYRLQDQTLSSYILVKAVDGNNNERIVILPPTKGITPYSTLVLLGILIGAVVVAFWYFRKKRRAL